MTQDDHKRFPRLYVPFFLGEDIVLSDTQQHYLRNVMRLGAGDRLRLFNGVDGEYLAELKEINKKNVLISLLDKTHEQEISSDVIVIASLVKKEALELMIEKASELGAARFIPVISDHSVVHRFNADRARAIAVEAAEQCERLDVMEVDEPFPLSEVLGTWPPERKLLFCIERKEALPVMEILGAPNPPSALLVGPEGGFSREEMDFISGLDAAVPVSLGSRILRAETAMIAALSLIMATKNS